MEALKPNFDKLNGMMTAVCQDHETGEILMVAFMNPEAWEKSLATGKATFFSRSRKTLWTKGETSGNVLEIKSIQIDCDQDAVVLKVDAIGGAACHEGYKSCFFRSVEEGKLTLNQEPTFDPKEVYGK